MKNIYITDRDRARRPPMNHIWRRTDFLGYTFVASGVGLALVNLTQLHALKVAVLCEITRNDNN